MIDVDLVGVFYLWFVELRRDSTVHHTIFFDSCTVPATIVYTLCRDNISLSLEYQEGSSLKSHHLAPTHLSHARTQPHVSGSSRLSQECYRKKRSQRWCSDERTCAIRDDGTWAHVVEKLTLMSMVALTLSHICSETESDSHFYLLLQFFVSDIFGEAESYSHFYTKQVSGRSPRGRFAAPTPP